jgi:diguanylate cyclase (GGDEF)-like protein
MGGEEFCVLLWSTNLAGARIAAEGLRLAIAQSGFSGAMAGESVTASFGVAEREPGENFQSLFRRADAALYNAKQNGRNRVRANEMSGSDPKSERDVQFGAPLGVPL